MNKYVAGYLAAALVMVALDMLWLGVIAKSMYQQAIGHLLAGQPRLWAALLFYCVYPAGLLVFAMIPQAGDPAWGRTILMGAAFGSFAYATYDLSNLATLRDWPLGLTLVDIAWGTVLSAVSAGSGKAALNWAAQA